MLGLDIEKITATITRAVEKNIGVGEILTLLRSIDAQLKELVKQNKA
jgi:hypothetical protein